MTYKKIILILFGISCAMFALTFAFVPLYKTYCQITGINTAVIDPAIQPDLNRNILVQFTTATNNNLPWDFFPKKNSLATHPNENSRMIFVVKNNSKKTITVQAIPSLTPPIAAKYFHKIQCFCFSQQTLRAGESKEMPMIFRVDKNIPAEINTITLAYTLFDVTKDTSA
jgi:cytochrome c oxidase assembly protein subunit 11